MRPQAPNVLEIIQVEHVSGHRLRLTFNEGTVREVDFGPFLRKANHPDLARYRQMSKFKAFRLHHGELMWGDYEMIFPVADLYAGRI